MSTILHPCFESKIIETATVMKLKVAAASPKATEHVGWTFLQALTNISSNTEDTMEEEHIYTHPLSKSTSPRLSDKSLQICTENLGCETGSFIMDNNILSFSSFNYTLGNSSRKEQEQVEQQSQNSYSIKKVKKSRELPPPLTTMSGEKSVQVKTHRENGRLIIQTTEKPLKESCFLADRSDGRLKLCFLKDVFTKIDMRMNPDENEAEINKYDDPDENEEYQNQDEDDEDEEDCKEKASNEYGGGTGNSNYDIETENNMGKEKFQRLRMCKECGNNSNNNKKKLCNWEPLWVATS